MQTLTFKPIDIHKHFDLCVEFRADAFRISFGSDVDVYGTDNEGVKRYRQWLKQKMADIPNSCVHAWHSGQIVGQIEMGKWKVNPAIGYVNLFYLIPAYRGQGFSNQLNAHAVNFLKQLGFRTARLCVSPTNVRAVRFYEKHEWQDVGVRPDQPNVRYMEQQLDG